MFHVLPVSLFTVVWVFVAVFWFLFLFLLARCTRFCVCVCFVFWPHGLCVVSVSTQSLTLEVHTVWLIQAGGGIALGISEAIAVFLSERSALVTKANLIPRS